MFCSRSCKKRDKRHRDKTWESDKFPCDVCQKDFLRKHPRVLTCSAECRDIRNKRIKLDFAKTPEGKQRAKQARIKFNQNSKAKEVFFAARIKSVYGVTVEEYEQMLERQNHSCAICKIVPKSTNKRGLCIDHCHTTGVVRGLLCNNCNSLLGNAKEKASTLIAACAYLNSPVGTIYRVEEFHRSFGVDVPTNQKIPSGSTDNALKQTEESLMKLRSFLRENKSECALRLALIVEETAELATAFFENNLTKALDALADIRYVVDGTVSKCGLTPVFYEAFDRVHFSNMSKLGEDGAPIKDESGKIMKGPNYRPVDLSDLIDNGSH